LRGSRSILPGAVGAIGVGTVDVSGRTDGVGEVTELVEAVGAVGIVEAGGAVGVGGTYGAVGGTFVVC